MKNLTLRLLQKRESIVSTYHPWIFSGAFKSIPKDAEDGAIAHVYDSSGENLLALGYFTNGSIAVRVLSWTEVVIDSKFWLELIARCYILRNEVMVDLNNGTNAYRLMNGEGDGVPGLIIDVYNNYVVVQYHNAGIEVHNEAICTALHLHPAFKESTIYVNSKQKEKTGENLIATISENNIFFKCNISDGQKTGFFLDQRINRKLLSNYVKDKVVANLFCYTGGFSLYALTQNAKQVLSVDISAAAMAIVEENIALNKLDSSRHTSLTVDVMHWLKTVDDQSYDVLVVDPPAFAKSVRKKHNAVQAYKRLNTLAINKVKAGGYLFTFSCSQVVDRELFIHTIRSAAMETGRRVTIVEYLSQGPDHPINLYHQEGHYLKGLILRID